MMSYPTFLKVRNFLVDHGA
uniref:Uncharacterized protein n=1 Tax=Anguilla anguilla TaxID=7936 RepID=A0A0E9QGH7_ANGAN